MDSIKTVFSKIPSGVVAMTASALVLVAVAASLDSNTTVNVTESTMEESASDDDSAPGLYYAGLNVTQDKVQMELTIIDKQMAETMENDILQQIRPNVDSEESTTDEVPEQSTASKEGMEEHIVSEPEYVVEFTEEEYEILCTIVEAEAGDQDEKGKILVANVIINRVKHPTKFPDNIKGVVFANNGKTYQFSPTRPGGRYWRVTADEETRECVERALRGEDYSEGAIYFCMKTSPNSWFNTSLQFLFKHQDHYFYK